MKKVALRKQSGSIIDQYGIHVIIQIIQIVHHSLCRRLLELIKHLNQNKGDTLAILKC